MSQEERTSSLIGNWDNSQPSGEDEGKEEIEEQDVDDEEEEELSSPHQV